MTTLTKASLLLALAAAFSGAPAVAAPSPNQARGEITHLFDALEKSGCRFGRNGSWYDGAKARSHLASKYDYLSARATVDSAEAFIELAASRSSMSGQAYEVDCPGAGVRPSAQWLKEELGRYRRQAS